MTEPPTYPDSDVDTDDADVGPERRTTRALSPWQKVVGSLGVLVVLWVGSEMYDVVFYDGGGSGPGGDAPMENQDQEGEPSPPSSGPHDPSQFDH